jgi:hypothetical protein
LKNWVCGSWTSRADTSFAIVMPKTYSCNRSAVTVTGPEIALRKTSASSIS